MCGYEKKCFDTMRYWGRSPVSQDVDKSLSGTFNKLLRPLLPKRGFPLDNWRAQSHTEARTASREQVWSLSRGKIISYCKIIIIFFFVFFFVIASRWNLSTWIEKLSIAKRSLWKHKFLSYKFTGEKMQFLINLSYYLTPLSYISSLQARRYDPF